MRREWQDRKAKPPTCRSTGKIAFDNEIDAEIVLAKRRRQDKGEQRVYECTSCRGFHLTSWRSPGDPGQDWD